MPLQGAHPFFVERDGFEMARTWWRWYDVLDGLWSAAALGIMRDIESDRRVSRLRPGRAGTRPLLLDHEGFA